QSRNCAVESTWSSCLPFGNTVISWRYSASHGAVSGIWTKPFSITPVCEFAPVGKQVPPTRAAPSLVKALRDARGTLLFATGTSLSQRRSGVLFACRSGVPIACRLTGRRPLVRRQVGPYAHNTRRDSDTTAGSSDRPDST